MKVNTESIEIWALKAKARDLPVGRVYLVVLERRDDPYIKQVPVQKLYHLIRTIKERRGGEDPFKLHLYDIMSWKT